MWEQFLRVPWKFAFPKEGRKEERKKGKNTTQSDTFAWASEPMTQKASCFQVLNATFWNLVRSKWHQCGQLQQADASFDLLFAMVDSITEEK